MRKYNTLNFLQSGIGNYIRQSIPDQFYFTALLRKNWADIIGGGIASHSLPANIYNKTLTVFVDDPIWIQELSLNKDEMKANIQRYFNNPKFSSLFDTIRFKIGDINLELPENEDYTKKIDPKILKKIDESLKEIKDKSLHDALRHYLLQTQIKYEKNLK